MAPRRMYKALKTLLLAATTAAAALGIGAGSLKAQFYNPPHPVRGESIVSYADRLNRYDGLYDAATGQHGNGGIFYQWIYGP